MSNRLSEDSAINFKVDVRAWCDNNGLTPASLCRALNVNNGYLANVFARTAKPSNPFWFRLEEKTGLKKGDYCE